MVITGAVAFRAAAMTRGFTASTDRGRQMLAAEHDGTGTCRGAHYGDVARFGTGRRGLLQHDSGILRAAVLDLDCLRTGIYGWTFEDRAFFSRDLTEVGSIP